MTLENQLTELHSGLKSFVERSNGRLSRIEDQLNAIDAQVQRPPLGGVKSSNLAGEIVKKFLEGKDDFARYKNLSFEIASPTLAGKTVTSTGLYPAAAAGVIGNAGGANYGAVRALFRAVPIDTGSIFQVRETTPSGWNASPQTEGSDKNESTTTLSGDTIGVRTIAHWVDASKQALDDVAGLSEFLNSRLLWGLEAEVEAQILSGSNTGQNLNGLTNQATAFDATILSAADGWDLMTVIGAAATQCRIAGYRPSFVVLNPIDAFRLQFTRDTTGQYIAAPPSVPPIVESVAMAQGYFVVGDSTQAVVRVRQMATIDISESHAENFTKNIVTIRAEERLALQAISPTAFIYGSLNTSPA